MKNICTAALLLLSGVTLFSGQQQNLSNLKVNFSAERVSASDAIERFMAENKIKSFAYSTGELKNFRIQEVKCSNELLLDCANKILKGLPFKALIFNNAIIIRQKTKKVSVVSDTNENLLLVTTQPKRKDTIDLSNRESKIEEITLNAGYYAVKDKERTGSISKVTAKDIENQPVNNVLSTVQGRMAGVSITQNSGMPGGGFDIQIRGKNSLRTTSNTGIDGSQPLYVVDGVPIGSEMTSPYSGVILPGASINPLNSINPNDIESLEILKDADATAIYGSRGANGVVLITTKNGKPGKLQLSFNTTYGLSHVASKMKMMDTQQYLAMRKQAFANDGITAYPATAFDINGTWDQNRSTDWVKILIGNTASSSNSQLSITGGSETTTFLLGFGHSEQTTAFGSGFKYVSNNISSNISHRSLDRKFQLNVSNMFSIQKNNIVRSDVTRQAYWLAPNSPPLFSENGSLNWENNTFANPVAPYNSTYNNETKQLLTNINTAYELFSGFRVKLNGGINYQTLDEIAIQPNTMYNPSFALGQSSATSRASRSRQDRFSFIIEPQANWIYKSDGHEFDILIGGTFQRDLNQQGAMTGIGFESNQFIENIGAAQTKTISDQINTEYKYAAVFGRINYQFKNRYILNVTGRRDGSSRFGPNKRFANFGAVGAAWLFSEEAFLKNSKWLSFGKLRASFGSAGSDNIGDYQYLDTYTVSSSIYNAVTGLLPSRLYNPDYSWEKTVKLETAVELGFFKNRLNLTTAWYLNRSSNQLVGIQLPSITGFPSVLANLPAIVENTGFELELNARPFKSDRFQWDTGFNISFPKNKLISFPGLEGSTYTNQYMIGQPTSIIKVYQFEGINPQTGQYQFRDFNGDGKISSPDDNKVVEKIGVQFFGGWNNTLRYKNWDLSILFQLVKQRNRNYNNIMPVPGSMNNQPLAVLDVWSTENTSGFYAPYRSGVNAAHNLFQNSTAAISDASFIRLKNLQIGYKIPIKNGIFKDVKIYFQGQNLFTFTKYYGIDPEFIAMGYLPPLRTYAFGTQFNF
ncbi:SusC/RagA family TonB-linked outer membrane protein [Pedobacter sp. ISL-68]|uniref:SusC/RagA family TonB-linked outer membrane protein n=1 Tax=unclassified Pedobacter TaxID=2628915 RepID=UPI001BE84164|nr:MULTISPECIES: SusC/RagA family TonB-linked outer membrane protein [unclassified Pedobacter]MBT2559836.1 SusC/RagA family TonB-linked outer membrane protein [Pedobacter sp. ISL-64]MBT2592141.1 SusC/RagA family TonB-linked outer membrane protein [Pedobacter sp. ISL-68]